jgi:hypothetical protein
MIALPPKYVEGKRQDLTPRLRDAYSMFATKKMKQ